MMPSLREHQRFQQRLQVLHLSGLGCGEHNQTPTSLHVKQHEQQGLRHDENETAVASCEEVSIWKENGM
jgi:hypothetical protein